MHGLSINASRESCELKARTVLSTGIVGSIIFAIGCFTPALVLLFGLAGLSAWLGWWLDYFLLYPGLAFFLGITAYGLVILKRRRPR